MIKELKNHFFQVACLTNILVLILVTIFFPNADLSITSFWHIIGISVIGALIFGVLYPYLWQYGTLIASMNIIIMTVANFLGGFSTIFLFSEELFALVSPYWWAVLILTLILHIICFYFYRNYQNKKTAESLNRLTK